MRTAAALVALSTVLGLAIGPLTAHVGAQPPGPSPSDVSSPTNPPTGRTSSAGAMVAAVAVNVFRIPGKTLLCGLGTLTAGGLMILTFGTQYQAAGLVFREGCGGKWVIGPSDLDRDVDAPKAVRSGEPS